MGFKELQESVLNWAEDRDLLHKENSDKQFLKFVEEIFEFKEALTILRVAEKIFPDNKNDEIFTDVKLEMGDILVTLIIECYQLEIDPVDCLELAYEKIKDRGGKTINGTFVKQEDLEN